MSENITTIPNILKMVNEALNEEKWTRATLNNYTIHNFKELDGMLQEIFGENLQDEAKTLCEEHLRHTKNSIIALYLSGVISLSQQQIDDSHLIMLIGIFSDNHKWGIVEYLASRVLQYGENKEALRVLAECYDNENEVDKKYDIWERLIRVDFEEADIVRSLAERKEELGQTEEAVDYYKRALHRYINKKLFNNIREVWNKLIVYHPEETEFFFHAERKVAKILSDERAVQLLEDLYPHHKKKKSWDTAIGILKRILEYDAKNSWARKEIAECYREKYHDHSQVEEYVRLSNLTQSWRNVHDAIADFEKHISFDSGNFVFHREWGVGQIKKIKNDYIEIDFLKKRRHKMTLKMAVNALLILSKQHIWVLKSATNKEKLRKKVKEDIPWALKTVIRSLDNAADMKKIKAELVPSILTPGEWTGWSTAARRILREDNYFGNLPDKADYFVVREQPVSLEEKTFNRFKAEKDFFARIQIVDEYAFNTKSFEPTTESFAEMVEYFAAFLRSYQIVNEYVMASALLLNKIFSRYPFLSRSGAVDFAELIEQIDDMEGLFQKISSADLRRELLVQIKKNSGNWKDVYLALFPHALSRSILDDLMTGGYGKRLEELFLRTINGYREYRECFVWLVRNFFDDDWYVRLGVKYEKVLLNMIHLLDITYREIENRKDAVPNRRLNRQVQTYLFDEKRLEGFLFTADQDSIMRVYSLFWDLDSVDDAIKLDMRTPILKRFPDYRFAGEDVKEVAAGRGFFVAPASYETKQKALQQILEVDIPENSREIGEAIALGDLRENAEYRAAKEKQDQYNTAVGKLREELENAQIVHPRDVDGSRISFGTVAALYNRDTEETERYTILGPWESDPEKKIISYLSPFGNGLLNHGAGDEVSFTVNEKSYNFRVEAVEVADF